MYVLTTNVTETKASNDIPNIESSRLKLVSEMFLESCYFETNSNSRGQLVKLRTNSLAGFIKVF